MSTYRVVFSGQPAPGVDRDTAIANFARLLKRTPEQAAAAFAGKTLTLKKGVSKEEADKVCAALLKSGLQVRVEAEMPALELSDELEAMAAPKPAAPAAPKAPQPPANAPAVKIPANLEIVRDEDELAAAEEEAAKKRMVCPACKHEQAQAEVCEKCGVVIAKFLARQAAKAATEQTQQQANANDTNLYAPGDAAAETDETALPELFGITGHGRIGRVRYLGWSLAPLLPAIVAGVSMALLGKSGLVIGLLLLLFVAALFIRYTVLRLHDCNHSGWWALLLLAAVLPLVPGLQFLNIPVNILNGAMALYLTFRPGTAGSNRFGPPPTPNSGGVIAAAGIVVLLSVLGIVAGLMAPKPGTMPAGVDADTKAQFEAAMQHAMENDPEFREAMEDPEFRARMEQAMENAEAE